MSKQSKHNSQDKPVPPEAVDVIDGIPDRCGAGRKWKIVVGILVFGGWIAFLIYSLLAGRLRT